MNNSNFIDKVYGIIGFIWLLFMLMFPSDFKELKYMSLIILLLISFFEFFSRKKRISRNLILGIFIWLTYFLFSLLFGFFRGYSLDFSLISMYFITPLASMFLSNIINNEERFMSLNKMLILITFMIVSLDVIYILNRMGIISIPIDLNSPIFGSVFVNNQKLEFRITNQSSLIFLIPYIATLNFTHGYTNKKEKYLVITTLFLGVIVALLSGRRAFQIVVAISILLVIILLKFKKETFKFGRRKNPIKRLCQVLVVILVMISSYNWLGKALGLENLMGSVYQTFLSAFDFSAGSGEIRSNQTSMLINGWSNSPLIGNGLNSYLKNLIRSSKTPWSYEMVYFALLYQTGIIGITIFFGTVYFIIKKLYKRISTYESVTSNYFFAIMIGFISFIIAGASNPMVYYVWAWAFALIAYQLPTDSVD